MSIRNEIIILTQFDTIIDANIAKTKLDAYGIPCFLTGENMAGLYPGQQAIAFRVGLHIFEKDIDRAHEILMGSSGKMPADTVCPRCSSKNIQRDFPKKFLLKPLTALMAMFFGVFLPHKKIDHCLDCDWEF